MKTMKHDDGRISGHNDDKEKTMDEMKQREAEAKAALEPDAAEIAGSGVHPNILPSRKAAVDRKMARVREAAALYGRLRDDERKAFLILIGA